MPLDIFTVPHEKDWLHLKTDISQHASSSAYCQSRLCSFSAVTLIWKVGWCFRIANNTRRWPLVQGCWKSCKYCNNCSFYYSMQWKEWEFWPKAQSVLSHHVSHFFMDSHNINKYLPVTLHFRMLDYQALKCRLTFLKK